MLYLLFHDMTPFSCFARNKTLIRFHVFFDFNRLRYTTHGHAAGPVIGMWDNQGIVPGNGHYELFDDTCYSIELNVKKPVSEWDGQKVMMALEEDAVLTGSQMRWLHGRQKELHLIG
jgi:hypothetical protein